MQKIAKHSMVLFVIVTLVLISFGTSALAQNPIKEEEISAGEMAADFCFVRPLGIAATVFGTALFVVSLPFSALGGNTKAASKKMIAEPAKFTFRRPLGDF